MRDPLAERLLAQVMEWSEEDVAQERPILQSLAAYKYDEYQQFQPGMRFVESLALWLTQFNSKTEKEIAYKFVKENLIFYSSFEMNHLVEMAYPDYIKPQLIKKVAKKLGLNQWDITKINRSTEFTEAQNKTLFLGLSDGARIDVFRRINSRDLTHEQIYPTYEISEKRAESLLDELKKRLDQINGDDTETNKQKFQTVVLLDDFSASGLSYIREQDGEFKGKITKMYDSFSKSSNFISNLIDFDQTDFYVVLYLATEQARQHLESLINKIKKNNKSEFSIIVIHEINSDVKIKPEPKTRFNNLIETYYDATIEDPHTNIGGSGVKYGFASCGLPLILNHNTPNNSISLLWAETNKVRALFPRVKRHN